MCVLGADIRSVSDLSVLQWLSVQHGSHPITAILIQRSGRPHRHNGLIPPLNWRGTLNIAWAPFIYHPSFSPPPSIAQSITPQPPSPNLIPGLSIVAVCRSDLSPALAMWAGPDLAPDNSSFWLIPQSERQSECLLWSLDWFKYQHLYNAPYQQW